MNAEYDFSAGSRGKYAERYHLGVKLVVVDPELAAVFRIPNR
jgi:hypothetical protein